MLEKDFIIREIAVTKMIAEGFAKKGLAKGKSKVIDALKNKMKGNGGAGNSAIMKFVQAVLKVIAGAQAIRALVIATLARELPKIEDFIKKACKCQLKEMINCSNDPEIPYYIKNTGTGINVRVQDIDYFGLFTIDPVSEEGQLLYQDAFAGNASQDMHTFIYSALQNDAIVSPVSNDWGTSTMPNPIMTITYSSNTATDTDVLNIKASQYYSDHKTLTDFNNDYIDSLHLLPTAQMVNQIVDSVLGCISVKTNMLEFFLKRHEETNKMIEKLMDMEEEIDIDDSFFTFTKNEIWDIEQATRERKRGIRYFVTCDNIPASADSATLFAHTYSMETAATKQDLETAVTSTIDTISAQAAGNANDKDKLSFELEFFEQIFKAIGLTISNTILSPKLALLFQINHKIIYGVNSPAFKTPAEFIYKNRVLFRAILNIVVTLLIMFIMKEITKKLRELVLKNKAITLAEQVKLRKAQLISLVVGSPAMIKIMTKYNQMNAKL